MGPFLQKLLTEWILYAFLFRQGSCQNVLYYLKLIYRKKKVNTRITRIFRQHKFLEFRNLNVYDENPNSNFDFLYLFLFHEIVAESKITLWMDIRIIGIVGKLKPDILEVHC